MISLNRIKDHLINLTGYWIYKKEHLPIGIDLFFDLQNRFENKNITIVFDVGGNVGQSVEKFRKEFPNSIIYSFEPVISTFQELKAFSKRFKDVFCENIGFGSKTGQFFINIEKHNEWNSLIVKEGSSPTKQELINIDTIDNFMTRNNITNIDILKTDTEGSDLEVLKGAKTTLSKKKISFIYCEAGLYLDDTRHTNLNDLINFLKNYDYYFYSLYDIKEEGTKTCYANALFVNQKGKYFPNHL